MNTKLKEVFYEIFGERKEYEPHEDSRRIERVEIKMTKDEKDLLETLASRHKNKSDFIRYVIFKKYIDEFIKNN